jgi:hypothetical protein
MSGRVVQISVSNGGLPKTPVLVPGTVRAGDLVRVLAPGVGETS